MEKAIFVGFYKIGYIYNRNDSKLCNIVFKNRKNSY